MAVNFLKICCSRLGILILFFFLLIFDFIFVFLFKSNFLQRANHCNVLTWVPSASIKIVLSA